MERERELISYDDICDNVVAEAPNPPSVSASDISSRYIILPNGLHFDRYTNLIFDSASNIYLDQSLQNLFHWNPFRQTFSSVESTRNYMHRLATLNNWTTGENAEEKKKKENNEEQQSNPKRKRDAEEAENSEKLPQVDEAEEEAEGDGFVQPKSSALPLPFDPAASKTTSPPRPDQMTFDSTLGAFFDRQTGLYFDPRSSLFYDYDRTHPAAVFHYCRSTNEYMRVHVIDSPDPLSDEPVFDGGGNTAESNPTARPPRDRFFVEVIRTNDDRFQKQKITLGESNSDLVITIGRDKKNTISFSRDAETSNFHARIELITLFWKTTVYISDVGSRNGTFLNEMRLSESKVPSEEKKHILRDGDTIVIGRNELKFCTDKAIPNDEANVYAANNLPLPPVHNPNAERKKAMTRLTDDERKHRRAIAARYEDRAGARRANDGDVAPAPAVYIPQMSMNNAGYKMLMSMGWQKGTGLGRQEEGIQQPIKPVVVKGRQGLGFGKNT